MNAAECVTWSSLCVCLLGMVFFASRCQEHQSGLESSERQATAAASLAAQKRGTCVCEGAQ